MTLGSGFILKLVTLSLQGSTQLRVHVGTSLNYCLVSGQIIN